MKKKFRGSWILFFLFAVPLVATALKDEVDASAEQGDTVIFSYNASTIYQEVAIDTSGKTELTATIRAAETGYGTDTVLVGISLYGEGGGGIYFHDTGWVSLSSGGFTNISLSVNAQSVGSGWANVRSARLTVGGDDGEFWAGNYGPSIESASLKLDGTELLSNIEFASGNSGWTSSSGWQSCSALNGGSPCISSPPAPTSLVVNSLADTLDSGTLRWAITQANATAGGIYDSITFSNGLSGTISLTSSLPVISQNLTITGPGQSSLSIDGNNSYRQFFVNQNVSLTISGMTLKRGPSSSGGIIYNNRGTVAATNVSFTSMSGGSAVFNNNAGAVATYTNCTWDSLSIGIAGDYGSTPQLPSGTTTWEGYADSGFQNRTYVNNGTFSNNWAGIYNYRFTKVQNSTFSNNSYGASVTGLNRTQIYSSTFNSNTIGVYHSAWIPTTFNMGTDNRLIDGNTFSNNGTSIYLDDGWNNGYRNQSWSTVKNNTWDNQGTWISYSMWNGTSNIVQSALPTDTNVAFTQLLNTVPTTTTTTTSTTTTTTTSTTTTTTVPETTDTENTVPETTSTTEPEPDQTATTIELVPTQTTVEETTTTTTEPELQPEVTTTTEPELELEPETTTTIQVEPEKEVPLETTPEQEIVAEDPEPQPETLTEEVTEVTAENIDEILGEEVTPEVVDAVVDAIASGDIEITAEVAEQLADVLTSGEATEEQIIAVVSALIESGEVSSEIATELATSPEVLQAISSDEAEEIFSSIETSDLTEEAKSEITAAVQNAPEEVKNAFEGEINIYAEGFDDYVPVGSSIDVGTRRTLLAATTALASATAAMAANGGSGPSSGGSGPRSSGPSSGGSGDGPTGGNNNAARKEEEEGSEDEDEAPEIEGPDGDEEEGNFTRNSIFKYTEGTMEKRFSPLGFIKKFAKETAALAFTISGTVIVFATLSGDTRKITVIATSIAFAVHYLNAMLQNDE